MNSEIIIISTTSGVTKKVKEVLKMRDLNYPVYEATMERAFEISQKEIDKGAKVIICRGGTTAYLRDKVDVPVVDIRHGFIDIYLSVQLAKEISENIGFIGFSNLCEAAADYINIMKREMPIAQVNKDSEIEEKLMEFIDRGIEVVIGGFQLSEVAKKHGIAHVMGEADPAAINQSINEALHDLKIEQERKEKFETINAILNCTSEGIIAIERNGEIIHINEIAKEILGYKDEEHINQILPKSKLMYTASNGEEHIGEFLNVGNNSIVVSSVPIKIENRTIGAVATIQEENKIQFIDMEIRKKHLGSGHFAKKTFKDIIGSSKEINQVIRRAARYAKSDSTVLIIGETGTGKEVFAQSIHNLSSRNTQPFVAINCAALPENILESELFGYVKGAFTGARKEGKAGIFELAHNGTVFLDEIGEVSTDVQVKLLRVIQEKEVSRIGDDKVIPIDVRILAASNKNLIEEIHKGNFREDLYFRLGVLELEIPPLRDRKEDIEELVFHFIKEKSRKKIEVPLETINLFKEYNWPGNVRQLSNVIERLIVICEDSIIEKNIARDALKDMSLKKEVSAEIKKKASTEVELKLIKIIEELLNEKNVEFKHSHISRNEKSSDDVEYVKLPEEGFNIEQYFAIQEEKIIKDALSKHSGSREKTAEFLGVSKATLWRKMKKFNIK